MNFLGKLEKLFIVPADTFDNVKGKFPIGFFVWDCSKKEYFNSIYADVYDKNGSFIGKKLIEALNNSQYINDWIKPYRANKNDKKVIGKFPFKGNDFQNQNLIAIVHPNTIYNKEAGQFLINSDNLIYACIYFAVRHSIEATWLNDRDQFLYPNDRWKVDKEFQNDCFTFTLFHGQNKITSIDGINHWIPFAEDEVNARERFVSHFMNDFIKGKIKVTNTGLFNVQPQRDTPLEFSPEAQSVFDAGRELWKYYHSKPNVNVNASLYDIKEYFQGRNEKGKMNNKSTDETYTSLMVNLRDKLKQLAEKIEPKIYEYGFLKL